MFNNKIVFVLGAGASKEANFPLGNELKRDLGSHLNIKFEDFTRQISGDHLIVESLHLHVTSQGTRDINPYRAAGVMIHEAMPLARSIDNFLDAHRNDEKIALCGKLGISRRILLAEQSSPMYVNRVRERNVNFSALENTWYGQFFHLLTANVSLADVATIFRNLSIISFNYDRSIEQYLSHALAQYYKLSIERAEEIAKSLEILHPYGTVGRLPWQNSTPSVPYGGSDDPRELLLVAKQLRTFTEQVEDAASVEQMRAALHGAKSIIFLGFAFHDINMKLLTIGGEREVRSVYATAHKISPEDCDVIRNDVARCLASNGPITSIRNDLTCKGLFDQYWRTLAAM